MDSVVGTNEVRNPMESIHPQVSAAWPGRPTFRSRIGMGMKLPDHDESQEDRRLTQVDTGLLASRLAPDGDLSRRGIHVDPSSLLVTLGRIGRIGVLPSLVECTPDDRMTQQLRGSRRR